MIHINSSLSRSEQTDCGTARIRIDTEVNDWYGANFGQKINCYFGQWYLYNLMINDRPIMHIDWFYRPKLLIDRFYWPMLLIDQFYRLMLPIIRFYRPMLPIIRFYRPMLPISTNFIDQWYPSVPVIPPQSQSLASFPGPAQLFRTTCTSNEKLGGAWERG